MGTDVSFIFRASNPYIGGLRPSFFMVFGVQGSHYPSMLCECDLFPCKGKSVTFSLFQNGDFLCEECLGAPEGPFFLDCGLDAVGCQE